MHRNVEMYKSISYCLVLILEASFLILFYSYMNMVSLITLCEKRKITRRLLHLAEVFFFSSVHG